MLEEGSLQAAVNQRINQFHQDLDTICEQAVQGGKHGVLVKWGEGLSYEMSVDPNVPYGHIYEILHDE